MLEFRIPAQHSRLTSVLELTKLLSTYRSRRKTTVGVRRETDHLEPSGISQRFRSATCDIARVPVGEELVPIRVLRHASLASVQIRAKGSAKRDKIVSLIVAV